MTSSTAKEFRTSRSKMQHGLLIGAVCVLVGLGTLLFAGGGGTNRHLPAALLMLVGAGVAFNAWRKGRHAAAHLRIDDAGVWFAEWGATVPWNAIEEVYQSGSRMQPFVTLKVRDGAALLAVLPEGEARQLRGNRLWKDPELRIPFIAVEATKEEMLDALRAGMRNYGRRTAPTD